MISEASIEPPHDSTNTGSLIGFNDSSHHSDPPSGIGDIDLDVPIPHDELEQRLEVVKQSRETPIEDLMPSPE